MDIIKKSSQTDSSQAESAHEAYIKNAFTHTGWQNPVKVIPSKCDKDINEYGKNVTKAASHKLYCGIKNGN